MYPPFFFSRCLSINVDDYKPFFGGRNREKRKTVHPTNKTRQRLIRPRRHKNERITIFTITSPAQNVS